MRKAVHLGAKLGSFDSARDSVAKTLEVELTTKRVERLTERIGRERELSIAQWEALPLVEKLQAPKGIKAPAVAGVSCDGGRMQCCDLPEDAKSHWCETKVCVLLEIAPNPHDAAPCPQVPTKFPDVVRMEQVTREIAELAAHAVELGPLSPETADTDPRQIAADTLTYLTNSAAPPLSTVSGTAALAKPPAPETTNASRKSPPNQIHKVRRAPSDKGRIPRFVGLVIVGKPQ